MEDRWAGMIPLQAQGEIINEMARAIVSAITGDWLYATYTTSQFGGQGMGSFLIHDADGASRLGRDRITLDSYRRPVSLPFDLFDDLRQVMYQEGKGSWFTMVLTVHHNGPVKAEFDYDTEPDFGEGLLSVTPYYTSREQLQFHRDKDHQPDWYRSMLEEFIAAETERLSFWAERDRLWNTVGQSSEVSNSLRLVVLPSGIGVIVTDGYSNPAPAHPNDPGFELYMPSALFQQDLAVARQAWPCKGMNYLIMKTTDDDLDWPSRTANGPVDVTYVPNIANTTPDSWRDISSKEDVCGLLVGVPFPGIPDHLDGPAGPIKLIGVLPARPDEWRYLQNGDTDASAHLLSSLLALPPDQLASPERPSVVGGA